eukprot:6500884-Pyramimonas_sp.AAC.1
MMLAQLRTHRRACLHDACHAPLTSAPTPSSNHPSILCLPPYPHPFASQPPIDSPKSPATLCRSGAMLYMRPLERRLVWSKPLAHPTKRSRAILCAINATRALLTKRFWAIEFYIMPALHAHEQ